MEGHRLLDVPITDREVHQRNSDRERLFALSDTDDVRRNDESEPTIRRFGSLRSSIYQVNNPDYAIRSPITHQRIPSNFDETPPKIVDFDQPTGYTPHASYSRLDYPPELWRPFWTRKPTLGILLLMFLVMVVGLVLLWHYSNSLNGLAVSSSTAYYSWTYAPVAFMVLVVGLWRQVDFYFRLLAPWDALRKGPVSASQSLLLDYVSPVNVVSYIAAFQRGHIPVVLSITVFFALKVVTIFAAALLVSLPTTVTSNSTSAFSTKVFDASSFEPTAFPNVSHFTSDPVYAALGNLVYGLSYPPGVGPDYAYIPVSLSPGVSGDLWNATWAAQTDALSPRLSCTPLSVANRVNVTLRANITTANTTVDHISLSLPNGNTCSNWTRVRVYAMNPQRERTPLRQLEGTMQRAYCAGDQEDGSKLLEPAGLLFTVTDFRYTQFVFSNGTIANSTRTLAAMSNLLCVPGYYVQKANINNSSAILGPNAVNIQMSEAENRTLDGLSKRNLAVLYEGIVNASQGIFGTRGENTQTLEVPKTVFKMMEMATNQSSLEPFLDPKNMQPAAEDTFQRIMSHYTAQSLTKSEQSNLTAQAFYTNDKLHVSLIPFYIMLVGTALSALCTMVLMIVSPGPLVPKDPNLIAMSAAVLSRSPELNRLLRKQASSKTAMASALSEHEFGSAIATVEPGHHSFKLVMSKSTSKPILLSGKRVQKWWTPNFLLLPAFVLVVVLPLGLIAVLELLQRRSDADQGLLTVTVGTYTALYIHCIPVLVMLLIAAMVGYLDFFVALFSPWNKLASGDSSARRSLLSHLLGKLPPVAFLEAIQGRHFGAMFSILAATLASMFAIIGSGLYSVQNLTMTGLPERLVAADSFQLQNSYSVFNDRGAAGMVRMFDVANATYPDGTYDELVFPTYSEHRSQNMSAIPVDFTVGPFTATVPALRADLQCNVVPDSYLNVTYVPASRSYNSDHYRVDTYYTLPQFCHYGGTYRNSSIARFRNVFNVTKNDTILYGGQLLDLVFGENSSAIANYGETRAATVGDSPAVGCPSLAFMFAEFQSASNTFELTPLVCYQQIQQMQVNVTYQRNSSELDPNQKPVAINSTTSLVTNPNSTTNVKSFDWRIERNVERQLYGLQGAKLQSTNTTTTYQFDAFFSYLLNNTLKQDPAALAGASNQQTLINAITTLYRKYMVQAINANMRQSSTPATNGYINDHNQKRQSAPSTVEMPTSVIRSRLIQDRTSKLVLQVLLGLSTLFSILAYMLTSCHHLLPYNPCSIAGTMSLLAGSDLCWTPEDSLCDCCGRPRRRSWNHEQEATHNEDMINAHPGEYHLASNASANTNLRNQIIPEGAEWMDHIKFAAIFAARTYSLGWWREDHARGRRRRFGIDIGGRPDGDHDDDWELSDRPPIGEQGFESFMMKGRNMLGGDRRGQYQRADLGAVPSTGPGFEPSPGSALAMKSSPILAITSPRRVRFEDDV